MYRDYWFDSYKIEVDKNFFEEYKEYLKIDGKTFNLESDYPKIIGCTFLVTKSNKDFKGQCGENKYVYIDDNNISIDTYHVLYPRIKLNNTAIMLNDAFLMSNLLYPAENIESAKQNIQNAFDHFGIKEDISIISTFNSYELDQAKTNLIDGISALICSLFSIMIATSFYAYMLFLKNKNEMILGIIMGYSTLKSMKKSFIELLIISIITLMILIFLKISLFSLTIFGFLLLIQIIILYINTKKLMQKSIVNFTKGEE